MINAQLIHDYLDGEVDSGTEEMLFAQLRADSDMRKEFNTQMKIVSLAQRDKAMTIPPPALTNSLFNKLGYDVPMTGAILKPEMGFFRKNMIWLLLLLLTVSTVSTVYFANRNSLLNNEIAKIGKVQSRKSIPVTSSFEVNKNNNASTDLSKSQDNNSGSGINNNSLFSNSGKNGNNSTYKNQNSSGKNSNRNAKKSASTGSVLSGDENGSVLAVNNNESVDENLIIHTSKLSKNSDHNTIKNIKMNNDLNNYASRFGNNSGFILDLSNSQLYLIEKSKINFQLKILNSVGSSPNVSIGNNANLYDNFSISGWYQINPFISVGIEGGKEQFSQEFSTKNNLVYQQRPGLIWYGASFRYSAKELIIPYLIYPYFQMFAGATTIGPLFKPQAGMVFNLFGPVSFVGGVEYGVLFYNVDSKTYTTSKVNGILGVSINF